MAAYSAMLCGAAEVYGVDQIPERLNKVKAIGAIPINFNKGDPVEQIRSMRHGDGGDKGIDAVGYQARVPVTGMEDPSYVLNALSQIGNATGLLGIIGLYVSTHPRAKNRNAAHPEVMHSLA